MSSFDAARARRIGHSVTQHVDADDVGGVAWLAACGDDVHAGTAGRLTRGDAAAVERDTVFRIASITKPITAVAALILVEEHRVRLDDPVDALLPELADRRVLVDGRGPIDGDTEPARRPITLHDVLTFRTGLGIDFAAPFPQPLMQAMDELGIGTAPPAPQVAPEPEEWLRKLATLPLLHHPGERWTYHHSADILGVLIGRAAGQPFSDVLHERVFEPLGMVDTAFAARDVARLGSSYERDPATGEPVVFDPPSGQWSTMPAFPSGGGGLVSTLGDLHAFGRMLLAGGRRPDGGHLVSRAAVEAMTTDQLGVLAGAPGPAPDAAQGWGFGVGVQVRRTGLGPTVGTYGWTGGLGSSWANDPNHGVVGIILTTDAFASAFPLPAVIQDFWTDVYAALE
jgi:CubicO group peptidase (beta-lactamase class C family)